LISRRFFIGGAATVPLMHLSPASAANKTAQTIFMMDAVAEIKRNAGIPTTANDSNDLHNQAKKLRDFQTRRPKRTGFDYWGGVCIPVPFADFDYYYTDGATSWVPNEGQNLPEVTVPHGFCTDLASIPQAFWSSGLTPTGRYAYAAIVHDFLYWTQTTTQLVADDILFAAMKDSQVNLPTRYIIYEPLRAGFGKSAWNGNAKAKAAGAKRFLKVLPPRGKRVFWKDWSKDPSHFSD
jgi:hypothetical protein